MQAHVPPGPIDGICGRRTLQAIERFQSTFLSPPDGRVDVNGSTWHHLQYTSHELARPPSSSSPPHAVAARPTLAPQVAPPRSASSNLQPRPVQASPPPRSLAGADPTPASSSQRTLASPSPAPAANGETSSSHYWRTRTPAPSPSDVNQGLTCPSAAHMTAVLGDPHGPVLQRIKTDYAGPLHVTSLDVALDSLKGIMGKVSREQPSLYRVLGTDGMHVIRNIRGRSCYSNHSWGTAIDIAIDRLTVPLGSTESCKGLDVLYSYFHNEGWFWGGGYHGRKDCMHFELSLQKIGTVRL